MLGSSSAWLLDFTSLCCLPRGPFVALLLRFVADDSLESDYEILQMDTAYAEDHLESRPDGTIAVARSRKECYFVSEFLNPAGHICFQLTRDLIHECQRTGCALCTFLALNPPVLGTQDTTFTFGVNTKGHVWYYSNTTGLGYQIYRSRDTIQQSDSQACAVTSIYSDTPAHDTLDLDFFISAFQELPEIAKNNVDRLVMARDWFFHCCEHHKDCKAPIPSLEDPSICPRRIIDVGDASTAPRLCDSASVTSSDRSYVALSHCWGSAQTYNTTKKTIHARMQEMHCNDMPKTFQDAIVVTRSLGLRFLWIDSLCIVQDDTNDWAQESAVMGHIYANAILTIAAVSAVDDNGGLFEHILQSMFTCSYPKNVAENLLNLRIRPHPHSGEGRLNFSRWARRGWVFQERYLSKRVLYFGSNEIYWKCRTSKQCECGHFNKCGAVDDFIPDPYNILQLSNQEVYDWWRTEIIPANSRLSLTKPTDRLPALSGLANAVRLRTNDVYLAGLWRSDLPQSLLWHTPWPHAIRPTVPECYIAPSWSWASISPISRGNPFRYLELDRQLVKILAYHSEQSTVDPTGAISSASLRLRCPLLAIYVDLSKYHLHRYWNATLIEGKSFDLWLHPDTAYSLIEVDTPNGRQATLARSNAEDYAGHATVHLAIFGLQNRYSKTYPHDPVGLVLGLSPTEPGLYTRLGTFYACPCDPHTEKTREENIDFQAFLQDHITDFEIV